MRLIEAISSQPQVRAIGLSGSQKSLPAPGEGDLDYFVYCTEIPPVEQRQEILESLKPDASQVKINCIQSPHWGHADYLLLQGVDTWLMYFTIDETVEDLEAILAGKFPGRIDGDYYPIGRCAMFQTLVGQYDPDDVLASIQTRVKVYPEELACLILEKHLEDLQDREDFDRAISRKDILF